MIETMLTVFAVVMVISVSAVVGYLLGERRGLKRAVQAKEPEEDFKGNWKQNALLQGIKGRCETVLFNGNREN